MKRVMLVTVLVVAATATLVASDRSPRGNGRKAPKEEVVDRDPVPATYVHFSLGEQQVIRDYYAPRYQSLPPGLRKKIARGGQLPAGWQKRMQPFPVEIERRLAPMPRDYGRGVIDGHAVIFRTGPETVIDVTALF